MWQSFNVGEVARKLRTNIERGLSKEEAEKRLNMQNTNEFFEENADYIIYNKESMKDIEKQLKKIKI